MLRKLELITPSPLIKVLGYLIEKRAETGKNRSYKISEIIEELEFSNNGLYREFRNHVKSFNEINEESFFTIIKPSREIKIALNLDNDLVRRLLFIELLHAEKFMKTFETYLKSFVSTM